MKLVELRDSRVGSDMVQGCARLRTRLMNEILYVRHCTYTTCVVGSGHLSITVLIPRRSQGLQHSNLYHSSLLPWVKEAGSVRYVALVVNRPNNYDIHYYKENPCKSCGGPTPLLYCRSDLGDMLKRLDQPVSISSRTHATFIIPNAHAISEPLSTWLSSDELMAYSPFLSSLPDASIGTGRGTSSDTDVDRSNRDATAGSCVVAEFVFNSLT